MGFQSYTDLSRTFGRDSEERRFPDLYRKQQQQQAQAQSQLANAQFAPYGSLEQRSNPMAFGSVGRRQNQAMAGAYDAQQAELAQKQKDEEEMRARRDSLMRTAKTTPSLDPTLDYSQLFQGA